MSRSAFYDTPAALAAREKRFAGDRQGRVSKPGQIVSFRESGARVDVLLGVMSVGEITIDPAGSEFIWSCFLPMTPRMQRAGSLEKAQGAVDFKVREWCEAAGVVVSAAALARLKGDKA